MDEINAAQNEPDPHIRSAEAEVSARAEVEKAGKVIAITDELNVFFSKAAAMSRQNRATLMNIARNNRTLSQTKYNSIMKFETKLRQLEALVAAKYEGFQANIVTTQIPSPLSRASEKK